MGEWPLSPRRGPCARSPRQSAPPSSPSRAACNSAATGLLADGGLARRADGGADSQGFSKLTLAPLNDVVTIVPGGPPTVIPYSESETGPDGKSHDMTAETGFSLAAQARGTFSGSQFSSSGIAGATQVQASFGALSAQTNRTLKVEVNDTSACPGCPAFPPMGATACSGSAAAPTLVYPPDGVT